MLPLANRDEMIRDVCASYSAGEQASAIANRWGISPSSIYNFLYRAGVPIRSHSNRLMASTPLENQPPRVDRDPCFKCGVRGDIGCCHRIAA